MGRKILKGFLWFLIGIAGLLILISILIYIPPVQNLIKNKAASVVSESTGMRLSIERFRLRFPLHITIDNTILITEQGDTLLRAGQIDAGVALWPLLAGQVQVARLGLKEAGVHYVDTLSAMTLIARLDEFTLKSTSVGLKDNRVRIGGAGLSRADVELLLGESHKPDTINVDTVPLLWNIRLDRLDVEKLGFRMRTSPTVTELTVDLPEGRVDEVDFDLGKQDVSVGAIRLREGQYAYLTDTTTVVPAPVVLKSDSVEASSKPWTVRLYRLELADNGVRYGILNGEPQPGFDFNHIRLSALNLRIDDVYYRESDIAATIKELTVKERSGLEITRTEGRLAMDSARIALQDFNLQTPRSSLSATAEAAAGLLRQDPSAPLSATLQASISPEDLYYFYAPDDALRRVLAGQTLRVDGDVAGTLARLNLNTLTAELPGHIDFRADGQVLNLLDTDNLAGNLKLNGEFRDLGFIRPMLPDSLRERIGFPGVMTLGGSVAVAGQRYAPDLRLTADSGALAVKGVVDLRRETYDADVSIDAFPLYAFLPNDSLGALSLTLTAAGTGFDPRREGAAADVKLSLEQFTYKEYTYHDLSLDARLADHLLNGELASANEAMRLNLGITGELRPEKYAAHLTGKIDTLDLHRMGFMTEPFDASLYLDAEVTVTPDTAYRADLLVDSVRWRHGARAERIPRTTLTAAANSGRMTAKARSGDLTLDFNAPVSLDSLLASFTRVGEQVSAQVEARSLDMAGIQEALPPFSLTASARQDNVLHSLMSASGMDFRSIDVNATTLDGQPFRLDAVIGSLKTGSLTLDTLNVGLRRNDRQLDYFVRLANRPGNIEQMALIALSGNVLENRAVANLYQCNRADSVGFRFGLNAELQDSAVRVQLTPERPVFGFVPWQVNTDNYLLYRFDKFLDANLRLEVPQSGQHVYIVSAPLEPSLPTGAIKLDMAGIDIGEALGLLPAPPAIAGVLNTELGFGFDRGQIVASGSLGVNDLAYDSRRVGSLGLDLDFQSDSLNRFMLDAALRVEGQPVLKADGTYLTGGDGSLAFRATIQSFPLTLANAFLPEETARLEGALTGWVSVSGSSGNPVVNGELRFAGGKLAVPMIGTTFGIADRPIAIADSRLTFDKFGLTDPDNQPFTIDGTVDFSDFSRLTTDLALRATNFNVVRSGRSGGSQVYGRAPVDVSLTARGVVNALTVRGDVRLRRGTDITYTLREGPLEVEDVKQELVTFVDFNDPATFEAADSTNRVEVFGIDLLVNIDIEENIQATVNISENGNNRAEVAGNGNLTFTLNTQGDSRFMGRFDIASGRILYQPPVISQKDFTIDENSYVEWTGEMLNPTFDITATEKVRTTVKGEYEGTVDFEISILVRNSLEHIDVSFDLAAPNTLPIQNELSLMTPESRSQQAMALLLYNTYTGPGSSATVDTGNPLNAFISKELNQWARNNLKGVDVSFGIDSYDDAGGGTHTDYSYQVSKNLFNDRVKVTIGGSVNPDAGTDENLKNNFVDDVSLEYRLTERDNMFLKAYRYNTQESILEGEVVETGVGFLMRKRMNRLNELFKLAPKEERRKKRELRREIRQQEREEAVAPPEAAH